jgi:hypothetical protein
MISLKPREPASHVQAFGWEKSLAPRVELIREGLDLE